MFVSVASDVNEKISAQEGMDTTFENSTLDDIKCHLANENKKLNMKKVEMLQSSLNYGKWLTLAYRKFQSDAKLDDEWARWLFIYTGTRMWANAQPDGRPAEHRWRPLFNAAKFG